MASVDYTWASKAKTGEAYLWRGQTNYSNGFKLKNKTTGAVIAWATPPQMEIPVAGSTSIFVDASVDTGTNTAAWVFNSTQSTAAIDAGVMFIVYEGLRLSTISVKEN